MDNRKYFASRRTVRQFDHSKPLSADEIKEMLVLAAQAPNTGNMQLYSAIVTTDAEGIAALAPAHFSQPASTGAQALVTFCLDLNRFNRWCRLSHTEPGMGNLQGFTWAVIDTSVFAQQFVTIAEMNGLGTCYLGTTTFNAPDIARILGLPEGVVPVVTVAVGHPAAQPPLTPRLPAEAYIHEGRYHNPDDAGLLALYAEEESLEENKRFVAENSKQNLAQVFAEVRYPREGNEHFSRLYREFLRANGIDL